MKEVVKRRFADADVSPIVVASLIRPLAIEELGLLDRSRDGSVRAAQTVDKIRTIGVPVTFMFVLFIIVMTTTPQLLNSVLEEKMSRISEVLLGSVTPFQLMLGKLLASTSVSAVLTLVLPDRRGLRRAALGVSRRHRPADGRVVRRVPAAGGARSTGRSSSRSARRART